MEDFPRLNAYGLLESVFMRSKMNGPPVDDSFISVELEGFNIQRSENQSSHDMKRFLLSCPEGTSHIASLMDFLIESARIRLRNSQGLTQGNCMSTSMSPTMHCHCCFTANKEARIEPAQENSHWEFHCPRQMHPMGLSNISLEKGKEPSHELTCEKTFMRIEKIFSHRLKSECISYQSNAHSEQQAQDMDGQESVSVSVTTDVFSPHEQDGDLWTLTDQATTLPTAASVAQPVVPSLSHFGTEADAAAVNTFAENRNSSEGSYSIKRMRGQVKGTPSLDLKAASNIRNPRIGTEADAAENTFADNRNSCEGSYSSKRMRGQVKGTPSLNLKAASVIRNPRSSPYNKKEANKNYRLTHRTAHIASERLRRKQMNEYFHMLREIIPSNYLPRFDQATILAAAVNLVKDLQSVLHRTEERMRERDGTITPVSPHNTGLMNLPEPHSLQSTCCNNTTTEVPGIDVQTGLYGQMHASLKSAAGEVHVHITQADIIVAVHTFRMQTDRLIIILEAFEDLGIQVSQINISSEEKQILYEIHTEIALHSNAKVIANRIHDSLLPLYFHTEGLP